MIPLKNLIGDYDMFLEKVLAHLSDIGIETNNQSIDHLAYRCPTKENYDQLKTGLTDYGTLVGENIISNRPIAVFKLNAPIKYKAHEIPYFELLAPKKVHKHINGLQHIEIVVDKSLSEFIKDYPEIDFDTEDIGRGINPEIDLEFPDGTEVKFHNLDIETAMKRQKETGKL